MRIKCELAVDQSIRFANRFEFSSSVDRPLVLWFLCTYISAQFCKLVDDKPNKCEARPNEELIFTINCCIVFYTAVMSIRTHKYTQSSHALVTVIHNGLWNCQTMKKKATVTPTT